LSRVLLGHIYFRNLIQIILVKKNERKGILDVEKMHNNKVVSEYMKK
jgi:hypothetical protein